MEKERFSRPRGTRDFRPAEMERRRSAEATLRRLFHLYGYREVATPTFEHVELFTRRSGEGVKRQLYDFKDKGDRDLTLRPELTAPVLRFYVNELSREPKPLKLYYFGNCFRYEEPQSGRFREFWQFGLELIGPRGPEADAEVIAIAAKAVGALGVADGELRVGHVGITKSLVEALDLPADIKGEVYRAIDKKEAENVAKLLSSVEDRELASSVTNLTVAGVPVMEKGEPPDFSSPDTTVEDIRAKVARRHAEVAQRVGAGWNELRSTVELLHAHGIPRATIDLGVVRGLDYYTGTVFEIHSASLGAESQVCGGGAYALAELFGGEPVGSSGFGLGFDRALLATAENASKVRGSLDAYIVPVGPEARKHATRLANVLRGHDLAVDADLMERSISKCLDYANAIEAKRVIIIGKKELESGVVAVKDMASGAQEEVRLDHLVGYLKGKK